MMRIDKLCLYSTVAAVSLLASPAVAQAAATSADFRIPSQPVQSAMLLFTQQSGVQILYPFDRVKGMKTRSIAGRMAPEAALEKMLAGTGLKVGRTGANVMTLIGVTQRNADNARPVRLASLEGAPMPGGVAITGGASAAVIAAAALAPQAAAETVAEDAEQIVVTGSRGLPRTITESPTPIDVISGAELERTGRPGVIAALNTLVPSYNSPTRPGGGIATVISTGGLRGLNPDQALILVNGKRRHKTSLINAVSAFYLGSVPADLDLIPTSAVDHIEVLRDGAAAQYGSDAIAGVINIILKSNTNGGGASATVGQNYDRSDGEQFLGQANYGMALGESGFLDLFVNGKIQKNSNRAVPIASTIRLYPLVNGQPDPREATIDRLVTKNYGNFPIEGFNSGYNVSYEVAPDISLYSFGTFSKRESELNFTFRAPTNNTSLPELYPNGYRPYLNIDERDFEFALGVKGTLSGWDWDISSTYGYNRSDQNGHETLNPSLGPTSPTDLYVGSLKSTEWVNSVDVTKGFDFAGHLQVSGGIQHRRETYAVIEGEPDSYRAGTYTYRVNGVLQRPAPGGQAANGFTPADAGRISRNNISAYIDLAYDPSASTTIGLAGRFEHYDDASGDTVIGKLTLRQAVSDWFSLRAAANTGFRAPGLAQQIYASTSGQFRTINGVINRLEIKTLPVGSPAAIALGSEPLTPEKSTNFSAGFVMTPIQNFSLTVDAYQVKVKDRITVTSTLTGPAVSAILIANGLSPDISAQYYTNAIDTRTRGVDVVATYRHSLGDFNMSWNLGYNYNKTIITRIKANPPELASLGAGYVLFDRRSRMYLTKNFPKTKLFLGNVTTAGPFTLSTRVTRYGAFNSFENDVSLDRTFGAKILVDTELAWAATKKLELAVGANNLFNVYPQYNSAGFNANLGSGFYATNAAYGFTGGYYYGKVTVKF